MNRTKRKVSCTFKREIPLEFQERIYPLPEQRKFITVRRVGAGFKRKSKNAYAHPCTERKD